MYILCIDTANFSYSAAIVRYTPLNQQCEIIIYDRLDDQHNNIANFIPFIDRMLVKAKLNYYDFNYVSLSCGPGSFTGIRVGLAFAHGMRLSTNVQVIAINSFEMALVAVLNENTNKLPILTVLESRRRDKYFKLYDADMNVMKPAATLMVEDQHSYLMDNMMLTGNGRDAVGIDAYNIIYSATPMFDARHISIYSCQIIQQGKLSNYPLEPYYLHSLNSYKVAED